MQQHAESETPSPSFTLKAETSPPLNGCDVAGRGNWKPVRLNINRKGKPEMSKPRRNLKPAPSPRGRLRADVFAVGRAVRARKVPTYQERKKTAFPSVIYEKTKAEITLRKIERLKYVN